MTLSPRIIFALAAIASAIPANAGQNNTVPVISEPMLHYQTELDPAYCRWVPQPGEMLGFWYASYDETAERTHANAYSRHESLMVIRKDGRGEAALHPMHDGPRPWMRATVDIPAPFCEVRILVSTAVPGAAGKGTLTNVGTPGRPEVVVEAQQVDAAQDPWLVLRPLTPLPAGRYAIEVRAAHGPIDVWPEPANAVTASLEDPVGNVSGTGLLLRGEITFADGATQAWHDEAIEAYHIPIEHLDARTDAPGDYGQGVGEHNNPFFVSYPEWFIKAYPQAFMRGPDGNPIGVGHILSGGFNPVPAVDDPTLSNLSSQLISVRTKSRHRDPHLRYWVIGGEEAYPDVFGLPPGDFRPAALTHFARYLEMRGQSPPSTPASMLSVERHNDGPAWYAFRERAFTDRAARYMQDFLDQDTSRPVFYPTHGNPFFPNSQRLMGFSAVAVAGACDGFETGQISIGHDIEILNLLTLGLYTSFGMPVVTPRLANKTLDPGALGGGRGFSPEMLRRLVYECLGMGVWHIGLVQWTGDLPDGEWHIKDTPAEHTVAEVFNEIRHASPILAGTARVRPKIGIYVSDATWRLEGWNAAWTGFMQDAFKAGWNVSIISDGHLRSALAERTPALVSIENATVSETAARGLDDYLGNGGRLYTVGAFLTRDDALEPATFGTAIAGRHPGRFRSLDGARLDTERTLDNMASTLRGAHVESRAYRPVDRDVVRDALLQDFSESVFGPVALDAGGAHVTMLPLSDGAGLVVVLINHEATAIPAILTLRDVIPSFRESIRWESLAASERHDPAAQSPDPYACILAPYGTALLWVYQNVTRDEADSALTRAAEAVRGWTSRGADTVGFVARLEQGRTALEAGLPAKSYTLAQSILMALAVRLEWRDVAAPPLPSSGAGASSAESQSPVPEVHAWVWDASGTAIHDARVEFRITPGPYAWAPMVPVKSGSYFAQVHEAPKRYDPTDQTYRSMTGPVRLIGHASSGDRVGGCMEIVRILER